MSILPSPPPHFSSNGPRLAATGAFGSRESSTKGGIWYIYYLTAGRHLLLLLLLELVVKRGKPNMVSLCVGYVCAEFIARF